LVPDVLDVAVGGVRDFAEAIELSNVRLERISGASKRPIRDGCSDRRLDRCRRFRSAGLLLRRHAIRYCRGHCYQKNCWPVLAHDTPWGVRMLLLCNAD